MNLSVKEAFDLLLDNRTIMVSMDDDADYYSTLGFYYLVETRKDLLMFLRKEK